MKRFFTEFIKDESGQDLVEYALLLAGVAAIVIASAATFSNTMVTKMGAVNSAINAS